MAHSLNYQNEQQRRIEESQYPVHTNLPAKPLPVASIIVASQRSSNATHGVDSHRSSSSRLSSPKAAGSLSGSSTASYSQPASLESERRHHESFASFSDPESGRGRENPSHRHGKNMLCTQHTRQPQESLHQPAYARPAEPATFTYEYRREEAFDEDTRLEDHTLWILVCFIYLESVQLGKSLISLHRSGFRHSALSLAWSSASIQWVFSSS